MHIFDPKNHNQQNFNPKIINGFSDVAFAADCGGVPITTACDAANLKCCDGNLQTALSMDCKGKPIYENPDWYVF
jgi:hypothetical protein